MGWLQKVTVIGLLVAGATTLILPGRQTTGVIDSTRKLITGETSTIMGQSSGVQ